MKISKKLLLSAALLCPMLAFSACATPPSYLITASVSEDSWGRIIGATTKEMEEGSKINLTAVELDSQNHPFICWVKDYRKVYSTESEMEIEYSEETKGHYTALYDEQALPMRYASLSSISISENQFSNISFTINYSSSTSGSNNYSLFIEGSFENENIFETDNSTLIYFGSLGSQVEYKFEINLVLNSSQEETTQTLKFSNKVNTNSFADGRTFTLSDNFANSDLTINLNFEKVSYSMFHEINQ